MCSVDKVYVPAYKAHKKHPAVQVDDNLAALRTHHSMFDDRYVNLTGAAYLHNLKADNLQWIRNVGPRPGIPTFTNWSPLELERFLEETSARDRAQKRPSSP